MLNFYMMTVDLIQTNKKIFINLYIKDEALKQAWNEYVNDQTEFVHRALITGNKVSSIVSSEVAKYFSKN